MHDHINGHHIEAKSKRDIILLLPTIRWKEIYSILAGYLCPSWPNSRVQSNWFILVAC